MSNGSRIRITKLSKNESLIRFKTNGERMIQAVQVVRCWLGNLVGTVLTLREQVIDRPSFGFQALTP